MNESDNQGVFHEDRDFITDSRASILFANPRFIYVSIYTMFIFILVAIIWSVVAVIDEVTVATAKVVPPSSVQLVQNLEGGLMKAINVQEGDYVNEGQIIVELDSTNIDAMYKENLSKYEMLRVANIRLIAQANGQSNVIYSDQIKQHYPDIVKQQVKLFDANVNSFDNELLTLSNSLRLANEELGLTEPLAKKQLLSEYEIIKQKRLLSELTGKINEIKANYQKDALHEQEKNDSVMHSLAERVLGLKDRMDRTKVRAPVSGIVHNIVINTVGGVIQPGETIMEIIPQEKTSLIEAKVKPTDIAFISVGQDAMIKLDSYDFSIYGGIRGKVANISPSTILDQQGNSYYEVKLKTFTNHLTSNDKVLPIIPGMTAQVDILTGKKTVFDYIMKPIFKAKQTALRER